VNGGGWKYVKWSLFKKKGLYAFEIYMGGGGGGGVVCFWF